MENIPNYVAGTFIAIVVAVLCFLIYSVNAASPGKKNLTPSLVLAVLLGWIFLVSVQTFSGFFMDFSRPPRLMLYVGVCVVSIAVLFIVPKSRAFIAEMPITTLHYLHIIRVPVEMVLWWLAVWELVPIEMTFEGSNLDILSGISAPFAAVFMVGSRSKSRLGALIWNLIALALLVNIVSRAISLTPYFFQAGEGQLANMGVFYFPYVLLPTFVVPAVFFCHLASIYQLIFKKDQSQF
ncbi:MAG: hypothetical protein Tsb0034_09380 [Ekhidna sp.]